MNPERRLFDNVLDFGEPVLCGVLSLQGASRPKTGADDSKHDRMENRLEPLIESAVDEDVSRKRSRHLLPLEWCLGRIGKLPRGGVALRFHRARLFHGLNGPPYFSVGEMLRRNCGLQNGDTIGGPTNGF